MTVQIEQTSKRYKAIQAIGAGIALVSAIGAMGLNLYLEAQGSATQAVTVVGAIGFAVGAAVALYGTALAWWHHG